MRTPLKSIRDVAEYQLCTGCGVCASLSPETIQMTDVLQLGVRPIQKGDGTDPNDRKALAACPGLELRHQFPEENTDYVHSLRSAWGPVLEVWEGYAGDPAIRYAGSSGGAATALALFSLEKLGLQAVLHTAARRNAPYLNETVLSHNREDLLARTGSRYAPSSPGDGLRHIEQASQPCAFIGKPCDVAGVQNARALSTQLDSKLGVTIAFFCAGTPSTQGTIELLKKVGIDDPSTVTSLRYRGNGWPGRWVVKWTARDGESREASLSYAESWDFLQKYRQWRCYICPDHTGEFADIAVGDPWHEAPKEGEAGRSLIIARTKRGLDVIRRARDAGYIVKLREGPGLLPASQPNLLATRGRLWGQLLTLRVCGVAAPRFVGFPTFTHWLKHLSIKDRLLSLLGTYKRIRNKKLRERRRLAF